MNMYNIMNTAIGTPAGLEKALAAKLQELLDSIVWLKHGPVERLPTLNDRGFDLRVDLHVHGRGKIQLLAQCKSEPRPAQFPYVFEASESGPHPVLVLAAPFISPRMAEVCSEEGWSWFDLAGNCRLDIPGLLHVERSGLPPVHRRPRPVANLGTPAAGRVIRALLHPDHTGFRWTQRYMEEHFGLEQYRKQLKESIPEPSLGLINKVVRYLRDEALIEVCPNGGFQVRDPLKLLLAWRDAYRFDRHGRRDYFVLLQGSKLRSALAVFGAHVGGFAAYAAFSAADFLAPHVRQPKTWLYVREDSLSLFEEQLQAKQVSTGANLVLLIPEDDGVFYLCDGGALGDDRLACTNEIQTYVDLWHCGGRGQEAAEALLEQRLKPAWKERGLKA